MGCEPFIDVITYLFMLLNRQRIRLCMFDDLILVSQEIDGFKNKFWKWRNAS